MTREQIEMVKSSFEKIEPVAPYAARMFYARLFDLDPALQPLFKGDPAEQERKLMQMIWLAVRGLERPDLLIPAVRTLGARHAGYGVKNAHYETIGRALLWTLEKALPGDFDAQTREAWRTVYDLLAKTMKDAVRQPSEAVTIA